MNTILKWDWVPGPSRGPHYQDAEYKGCSCEMLHVDFRWQWSFYDPKSPDPETPVARGSETGWEQAEKALIAYIDGHVQ